MVLCRLSSLYVDTWITHLHLRGILMAVFLLLGTKTKHAVFGMLGTCQNLLLCLRATLELYVLYGLHLMDGSWQWLSQLTLCMSMMHRVGLRKSRRSIFLGRSLVYLLALTQNHFLLVSGIAPMEAFFSTIDGETICILTACKFVIAYLVFVKYLQFMFFCLGIWELWHHLTKKKNDRWHASSYNVGWYGRYINFVVLNNIDCQFLEPFFYYLLLMMEECVQNLYDGECYVCSFTSTGQSFSNICGRHFHRSL